MQGIKHYLSLLWQGTARSGSTYGSSDGWVIDNLASLGSYSTTSGVNVTPENAMRLSAVSACVRLISESIGSLPLHVYRRVDDSRRVRDTSTQQSRLLHDEPNRIMTSFVFRETMAAHVLVWGNAFAAILRDGAANPRELLPLHPACVTIKKAPNGELVYTVTLDHKTYTLNQADVLHVPGLAFDGICGMSPIRYAAQSIGLALAAEQYGSAFFGNGSMPSGVLKTASNLNAAQQKQIADSWMAAYGGSAKAHKTAVLANGAEFQRVSIAPEEAQFIETRKMQVGEIARWYRVPPHMIGDLEHATFSNIEHQALEFVTHTLRPWLVRFEQEFNRKLFPSAVDSGRPSNYYAEFNVDGLLRGDIKSRSDYYVRGRQWGWLSVNDVRTRENMEPIDNGDVYLTPLNMVDTKDPAADSSDSSQEDKQKDTQT
jgi:HK97 family phage portal protein